MENYSNSIENKCEDSGIFGNESYHYITLPPGTPSLPEGTRLSRKSTPSILLVKDEKTRVYYRLINNQWVLDD